MAELSGSGLHVPETRHGCTGEDQAVSHQSPIRGDLLMHDTPEPSDDPPEQ